MIFSHGLFLKCTLFLDYLSNYVIILLKIDKTLIFLQLISLNMQFFNNYLHLKSNYFTEKSAKHMLFQMTDFLNFKIFIIDLIHKYAIIYLKISRSRIFFSWWFFRNYLNICTVILLKISKSCIVSHLIV